MLSLVACFLVGTASLNPNAISAESPNGKQFVVEESDPRMSVPLPHAVLDDARVRDALQGWDPLAMKQALEDAINDLPPEVRERMEPVLILSSEAELGDYELLAEMLKANPSKAWQSMGIESDPRLITPEILRAGAAKDPKEREQLLREAIPSLPEDLQQRLANGFVVVDESVILDDPSAPSTANQASLRAPRISVDEALVSLSTEMRKSLRGYEDILADEKKLFRALRTMPEETRVAALRMHSLRFPNPGAEEAMAQLKLKVTAARERGYFLNENSIPLPKRLLARIRQARLIRVLDPAPPTAGHIPNPLAPFAAFQTIAEYEQAGGNPLPPMPAHGVPLGTEAYIDPWGMKGMARVFADSDFGAALAITEDSADEVSYADPNLTIFGRDAAVELTKYGDDEWATSVSAFDGRRTFRIDVAAKLEGQRRDDFVRFAKDAIENR